MQPLDQAPWAALTGRHAGLARRRGRAAAYLADVSPLAGLEDPHDPSAWADLADLLGPGATAFMVFPERVEIPAPFQPKLQRVILQMTGPSDIPPMPAEPAGLIRLGLEDGSEMVELAAATAPGPMSARTVLMGDYWGVRREGRLVAMAGQRMRLDGLVEISGVCTDPSVRGRGLARDLVIRVMRAIAEGGDRSFLHLKTENESALGLYRALGFEVRAEVWFCVLETPA